MTHTAPAPVVERVFREHRTKMLAALVRALGDFELTEDALQEACALALRRWPKSQVPDDPVAWLLLAARNRAIDRLRRARMAQVKQAEAWAGQLRAVAADRAGYQRLLDFARAQVPGRRCFAVEGAGSYGSGLARLLADQGEWVVEVDRPSRPARRGGKTDALDAVRAAREVLAQERLAAPRRGRDRQALRVLLATRQGAVTARTCAINQLKALIVGAPEELRAELRGRSTNSQVAVCAALRDRPAKTLEHRVTVRALRSTARRIQLLAAESAELEEQIRRLVAAVAPWLLELPGVGPLSAGQVLVSWSHTGRLRSEAAFAALAGVSPIPASSGQVTRHRLNRGGDRRLNRALHTMAVVRQRDDPEPAPMRPAGGRRQEPTRDPAVRKTGHCPAAVQAPRMLRSRRGPARQHFMTGAQHCAGRAYGVERRSFQKLALSRCQRSPDLAGSDCGVGAL